MSTSWMSEQEIVFQTLSRAITEDKVSHAYLFEGALGSPLYDAAIYLAQSLLAHPKELPCEKCDDCERVRRLSHGDILFIDGSIASIKKADIEMLQSQFAQSAIGKTGRQVYIIQNVERATTDAMNSILKFLEEPDSPITAIFLTNAVERVLPTIRSRCQIIKFTTPPFQDVYSKLKEQMDDFDAYMLAKIFSFEDYAITMLEDEAYILAKELFEKWCATFYKNPDEALVDLQLFIKSTKDKDLCKKTILYLIKMIKIFLLDCISGMQMIENSWYTNCVGNYRKRNYDFAEMLLIIVETQDKFNLLSIQIAMLVDRAMIQLMEVRHG